MNTPEEFPARQENKKEKLDKLFGKVAWGFEQIHQQADIASQLKVLEDDPEQWLEAAKVRIAELQRLTRAIEVSLDNREVSETLEVLSVITANKK
jgi:hypothetical protein